MQCNQFTRGVTEAVTVTVSVTAASNHQWPLTAVPYVHAWCAACCRVGAVPGGVSSCKLQTDTHMHTQVRHVRHEQ